MRITQPETVLSRNCIKTKIVSYTTMPSTQAEKQSTAEESLASHLVSRIKRGSYAPGQRLIEVDLMREFNIGRSKIRETLRNLAGQGYLTIEENRGVCVRKLTRKEALEIGRVREMLEGLAARQAAENELPAARKKELRDLQKAMDKTAAKMDIEAYAGLNARFHEFIMEASGNDYAAQMLERLSVPVVRLQFRSAFTLGGMLTRNEDHQKITKAILEGNPDKAEAAMRAHVNKGNKTLYQLDDDAFA